MTTDWNTTILCVDDEEDILNAYKDVLSQKKNEDAIEQRRDRNRKTVEQSSSDRSRTEIVYKLLLAKSGELAVKAVQNEINKGKRVSVGFFDMKMPGGIDGVETMRQILKIEPDMLCIVVTAYTDSSLDLIGSLFTSQDQWMYLSKPFSKLELEQTSYSMICSWNRRRKNEQGGKKLKKQNLELQEKIDKKKAQLSIKTDKLKLLNEISQKINSERNLEVLLKMIISSASELLNFKIGSVLLVDERQNSLVVKVASGPMNNLVINKKILIDKNTVSGYALLSQKPLIIDDIEKEDRFKDIKQQRTICKSFASIPLLHTNNPIGVMHLGKNTGIFTEEEVNFLVILAEQAAMAIENARLNKSTADGQLNTMQALAAAIDAKDPYTRGHSDRVTKYSIAIAKELSLSSKEIDAIIQAGLLHDIGKIGLSEKILNKPGELSPDDYKEIAKHPEKGEDIIAPITFYPKVKDYIRHHHENYDGSGYPDKMKGENIPLAARILAVADSYDAMTSDRSYRKSLSIDQAISELKKYSGTQFDPKIVEAFLKVLEKIDTLAQPVLPYNNP